MKSKFVDESSEVREKGPSITMEQSSALLRTDSMIVVGKLDVIQRFPDMGSVLKKLERM